MMQSFYPDAAVAAVGSQLKYGTGVNPLSPPTSVVTLTHTFKNTVTQAHKVWDVPCTHGGRYSIIHTASVLPHHSHACFKYRAAPYEKSFHIQPVIRKNNPYCGLSISHWSKFARWSHEGRLYISVFLSLLAKHPKGQTKCCYNSKDS